MKGRLFVIFSLLFPLLSNAQQSHELLQAATIAAEKNEIQSAVYFYRAYIENEHPTDPRLFLNYAHALRLSYLYVEADNAYEKVMFLDTASAFPEAVFYRAMTKKNLGKYTQASDLFKQYISLQNNDTTLLVKRALLELEACRLAPLWISDTLTVYIEALDTIINSPHSEFNAIQLSDTALYFSALRPITSNAHTYIIDDFYLSKIYSARFGVNGLDDIKPLHRRINNPNYHNANLFFNSDKTKLFFSRTPVTHHIQNNASLWVSELKKGKWQKPKKLPDHINAPGSNTTQACITPLNDSCDILYFVSNRPKGMGGQDIWYSIVNNGTYGEAINAGSNINTPGNEITPFYHNETKTLYFSSDWHAGLGGYDIFKAEGALSAWQEPVNLGYPINSPANDIYFTVNEVDKDGYFTSNRKSPYALTDATCCNDIFLYEWQESIPKTQIDTLWVADSVDIPSYLNKILPINLYFHNDEPDPKTMATTTDKNYKQTLDAYVAMKDLYKEEYAKGLDGEEKLKAENEIEDFFTDYVQKGYELLEELTSLLLRDLQRGKAVNITVSGFSSPLFSEEYNINLSLRRIESLRNYLKAYRNGLFLDYMDSTKINSLHILNAPKGKTMANPYVSDNPNDKRNSIYSMAAALERRIQVVGYDEDTIYSQKNLLHISTPDSLLIFTPTKGITNYVKYIEIKNLSADSLHITQFGWDTTCHVPTKTFDINIEKQTLAPNESTFIVIKFTFRNFIYNHSLCIQMQTMTANAQKTIHLKYLLKQ